MVVVGASDEILVETRDYIRSASGTCTFSLATRDVVSAASVSAGLASCQMPANIGSGDLGQSVEVLLALENRTVGSFTVQFLRPSELARADACFVALHDSVARTSSLQWRVDSMSEGFSYLRLGNKTFRSPSFEPLDSLHGSEHFRTVEDPSFILRDPAVSVETALVGVSAGGVSPESST